MVNNEKSGCQKFRAQVSARYSAAGYYPLSNLKCDTAVSPSKGHRKTMKLRNSIEKTIEKIKPKVSLKCSTKKKNKTQYILVIREAYYFL